MTLPLEALKLNGTYKHNQGHYDRIRGNEPKPRSGIGAAPVWLSKSQQKIWRELKSQADWLTIADRTAVEALCRLMDLMRTNQLLPSRYILVVQLLSKLGMTPSDRHKVSAPPKEEKKADEWSIFTSPPVNTNDKAD